MTGVPLPVEEWGRTVSYRMRIVQAVVADIRDHGPFDLDLVLAAIKRAGQGGDVRKASPFGDEHDGALRILNLMVEDLGVIAVINDHYTVPADVREVRSSFLGGVTIAVPSGTDLIARRDIGRRQAQLRAWLRQRPFHNQWKTEIRHWDADAILAMAVSIDTLGYFGPPIVRDQDGVIMDGHLRHLGLDAIGIDPAPHTVTRTFDGDLDRLAWIINAHMRPGEKENWQFPATLKTAITKLVDHGKPRGARKENWAPLRWPDELGLMLGKDRRHYDDPIEPSAPVAVDPPVVVGGPVEPAVKKERTVTLSERAVLQALTDGPASSFGLAKRLGINATSQAGARYTDLREDGLIEYALNEDGNPMREPTPSGKTTIVHRITDAGRAALKAAPATFRPKITSNRPGNRITGGDRLRAANRLISAINANSVVRRTELAGTQESDKVLRRMMWFVLDGTPYLVLPDTLGEKWATMGGRVLRPTERGNFIAALQQHDDDPNAIYEYYEELWEQAQNDK